MTKKLPPYPKAASVVGAATGAAVFGALVGGTTATAKGIRQVRKGRTTKDEVALNVAREAGSTAVAAGTAAAVVGALGLGAFLSVLGVAVVATTTKYAMDSLLAPKPAPAPAAKTAAKKATTTKTAPKKKTTKKAPAKKTAAPKAETKPETEKA